MLFQPPSNPMASYGTSAVNRQNNQLLGRPSMYGTPQGATAGSGFAMGTPNPQAGTGGAGMAPGAGAAPANPLAGNQGNIAAIIQALMQKGAV